MVYQYHFSIGSRVIPKTPLSTLLAGSIALAMVAFANTARADDLDWQWDANKAPASYCLGSYQPLAHTNSNADQAPESPYIYTDSDSSQFENGITTLQGNVIMQQGDQRLSSELVSIDTNTDMISVQDNVEYRRPGFLVTADNGKFGTDLNQANLQQVELVQFESELRATAANVTINSDDSMVLDEGTFSFCPPGDNSWHIASSQIDILPEQGVGEARNAVLHLGPVPIFYLPWVSFPIDEQRRSGFLYPQVSTTSNNGLYIATPYYLNLAPNSDAVVTPHWREHSGSYVTTQGRFLGSNGLHQSNALISIEDKQSSSNSWYADYTYAGTINDNDRLRAEIQLARASDFAPFNNFDYSSDHADNHKVSSHMAFNYKLGSDYIDNIQLGFKQHQQLSASAPTYNLLPYVNFSGQGGSGGNYHWLYNLSYDNFQRVSHNDLSDMQKINGQRVHFTPSAQYQWQSDYAYATPKLSLPMSFYQLTDTPSGLARSQNRSLYQLELDSGLLFERPTQGGGQQTLEPRLYWTYTPYRQQDSLPVFDTSTISKPLYQANRFTGPDRIGDTNRITLGVSSRVITTTGQQKAQLSLSQIHYLSDRQVQLSSSTATATETSSPFYGQMDYQINDKLSSSLSIDWNDRSNQLDALSANLRYHATSNKIIAANYTETSGSKQSQTSIIWPLAPQWTLFAQHKIDITNSTTLEQITGVEFANCCYKVRLVNRDWLVSQAAGQEHGVFLELELKGLGDSDTRLFGTGDAEIEEFMKNITGYNERFK